MIHELVCAELEKEQTAHERCHVVRNGVTVSHDGVLGNESKCYWNKSVADGDRVMENLRHYVVPFHFTYLRQIAPITFFYSFPLR